MEGNDGDTVWKNSNVSATYSDFIYVKSILAVFRMSKTTILTILEALHFDFLGFHI